MYSPPLRAKGNYTGLVSSVATEKERITTQCQPEVHFKAPPMSTEVTGNRAKLPVTKTELVNDQGVVSLMTNQSKEGLDSSSNESDVEMEPHVPSVAVKKRIHEEIGTAHEFELKFCFEMLDDVIFISTDLGDDSEEEPVILVSELK